MKILLALIIGYWIGKSKAKTKNWLYIGPNETKYNDAWIGLLFKK